MTIRIPLPELDRDMTAVSDEQLLRVVGLIDSLDRRGAVDRVLAPVRTRLAMLRPPRPLTLGRVTVVPFEDLLVARDEAWPGRLCFPRSELGWFVDQVTGGLSQTQLAQLREQAAGRSMLEGEAVLAIGSTLWPVAASTAERCAAMAGLDSSLRAQLAGVAPLLALGSELVSAIWSLPPRPMASLTRPALDVLLDTVRAAVAGGDMAVQSLLEVFLVRSSSPLVLLEPLRHANLGIAPGRREAVLTQLVRRRIADMREIAARQASPDAAVRRPSAAQLLRLVADLDVLETKWPTSADDRGALAEIRKRACVGVGAGIEAAVEQQILGPLSTLAHGDLSDDDVEQLEDCARNTRRLSIAGAKLGLAASPDAMLGPYLEAVHQAIGPDRATGRHRRGLLEQMRVVEIMFGSDAAARLYGELRCAASR